MHIHQVMINSRVLMTSSKNCIDTGRERRARNWSHLRKQPSTGKEEGQWRRPRGAAQAMPVDKPQSSPQRRRMGLAACGGRRHDQPSVVRGLVAGSPLPACNTNSTPSDMCTAWCNKLDGPACTIQPMCSRQLSSRPCRYRCIAEGSGCGAALQESGGTDKLESRAARVCPRQRINGSMPWNRWRRFRFLLPCHCLMPLAMSLPAYSGTLWTRTPI
jgi:hypothetical protein